MPNTLLIYVVLALMVAYMGRKNQLGFVRTFVLCCLLTPLVMLVYLLLFASIGRESDTRVNDRRER